MFVVEKTPEKASHPEQLFVTVTPPGALPHPDGLGTESVWRTVARLAAAER